MVLPGAAELVDAFSAIRPGPMRDSVVHMARMLAAEHGGASASTVVRADVATTEAPRLASPFASDLTSKSLEGQIIERALRGESPANIATDVGTDTENVRALMARARREGGVAFPGDVPEGKAPKPSVRKGRTLRLARMPLPDPPYWFDDPDSPIWDSPLPLPTYSEVPTGTLAAVGPHDRRTYSVMERAATKSGMSLKDYIARRREIVRRVADGETPTNVAIDMRVAPHQVYGVLSAVGQSRMDTINARPLPLGTAAEPSTPAPDLEHPLAGVDASPPAQSELDAWPPEARTKGARAMQLSSAHRWGFETLQDFNAARMRVRAFRMEGWSPNKIAEELKQSPSFVKAVLMYWGRERGVAFPEITLGGRWVA
jgi:hypothetical protein